MPQLLAKLPHCHAYAVTIDSEWHIVRPVTEMYSTPVEMYEIKKKKTATDTVNKLTRVIALPYAVFHTKV